MPQVLCVQSWLYLSEGSKWSWKWYGRGEMKKIWRLKQLSFKMRLPKGLYRKVPSNIRNQTIVEARAVWRKLTALKCLRLCVSFLIAIAAVLVCMDQQSCPVWHLLSSYFLVQCWNQKGENKEFCKESRKLAVCLYLASNSICAELVEKMVIGPLIITILDEGPAGASKKLHEKYSEFLAGKLIIFLLSINRKVVSMEWKKSKWANKNLRLVEICSVAKNTWRMSSGPWIWGQLVVEFCNFRAVSI